MSVNKVNSDGSLLRVAGGTLYADAPIGTISPFGGSVIPSGYLLCNGATISKTTYPELFSAIGYRHGGSCDDFKLPDLRVKMLLGVSSSHSLGSTGGKEKQQLNITHMPAHKHDVKTTSKDTNTTYTNSENMVGMSQAGYGIPCYSNTITPTNNVNDIIISESSKGSGTAFEILNPYMSVNYYISTGKSLL